MASKDATGTYGRCSEQQSIPQRLVGKAHGSALRKNQHLMSSADYTTSQSRFVPIPLIKTWVNQR